MDDCDRAYRLAKMMRKERDEYFERIKKLVAGLKIDRPLRLPDARDPDTGNIIERDNWQEMQAEADVAVMRMFAEVCANGLSLPGPDGEMVLHKIKLPAHLT